MDETKTATDAELMDRVRRRDRQAFASLYRRYQPRLFAYLRRFIRDSRLAEEVLDDVLFVVWKDARRFDGRAAVSTWIFGIAYRRAMTALRRELRHELPVDPGADADRIGAESSAAGRDLLAKALAELSVDHRQVVELTYFFGFSYAEIAAIAGCPENTVKTRMFHARRRLRQLLPVLAGQTEGNSRERA